MVQNFTKKPSSFGQSFRGITSTKEHYTVLIPQVETAVAKSISSLTQSGNQEAAALYAQVTAGNTAAVTQYVQTAGKLISVETLLKQMQHIYQEVLNL